MTTMATMEERFDGLAWAFMGLVGRLEDAGRLDGERYCAQLRAWAEGRRRAAGLETAALTLEQLADRIEAAREARPTPARPGRSRTRRG